MLEADQIILVVRQEQKIASDSGSTSFVFLLLPLKGRMSGVILFAASLFSASFILACFMT